MLRHAFSWINLWISLVWPRSNSVYIVHAKHLFVSCVLSLLLLANCSPAAVEPTLVATQPLVPASVTPTQPQPTVTPTPEPLTSASDINTQTSVSNDLVPLLVGDVLPSTAFLSTIQADLAQRLQVDPDRILLGQSSPATWTDANLGCGKTQNFAQAIDGYALTWIVNNTVYQVHTDGESSYAICSGSQRIHGELLLAVDAIAADMFGLVQRRLSNELDLPQQRIRLVDAYAVTWPDNSLGCPQPDESYTDAELRGYRIEVLVGETTYIFHTDDSRLVACAPDLEVLP